MPHHSGLADRPDADLAPAERAPMIAATIQLPRFRPTQGSHFSPDMLKKHYWTTRAAARGL